MPNYDGTVECRRTDYPQIISSIRKLVAQCAPPKKKDLGERIAGIPIIRAKKWYEPDHEKYGCQ